MEAILYSDAQGVWRMPPNSKSDPVSSWSSRWVVARIILVTTAVLTGWTQDSSACGQRRYRRCAAPAYYCSSAYSAYYPAGYAYPAGYTPTPLASPQSPSSQTQAAEPSQPAETQEQLDAKMRQEADRIQREVDNMLQQ
jgi:hypothetical protein